MQKFSARDIKNLITYLRENISVYAGDKKDQRVLIKPGLKITNKQSGLNYTVHSVMRDPEGKGLIISCTREPDVTITITSKDLKHFERT
jgi:hypothetical protein